LLFQQQCWALATAFLCIVLLIAVTNIGLGISWNSTQPSGPLGRWVGKKGICTTPLNPKGSVRIDAQVLNAMSEGIFIPEGQQVRVIRAGAKFVIVEKIEP
jgi:membrane-bound ClpP family serine protease